MPCANPEARVVVSMSGETKLASFELVSLEGGKGMVCDDMAEDHGVGMGDEDTVVCVLGWGPWYLCYEIAACTLHNTTFTLESLYRQVR